MAPVILLDVHMEDLEVILSDKNWNVKTVTKELGSSTEDRADDNIIKYAQYTKCVIVTDDGRFVQRLKAANIPVITIETSDKAKIIHEKLREKIRSIELNARIEVTTPIYPKNSLKYCKQHFYLL